MKTPDQTMYIAYHGNVYLKGATDSHRTGLKVQFTLEHEDDYKLFKGFRKHRKGKHYTGMYKVWFKPEKDKDEWVGPLEMWFKAWSLTPTHGAVLSFEMSPDNGPEWRFWRYNQKALEAGYRLDELTPMEMMVAELDGEGKVINIAQRAKLETMGRKKKWGKGGPQSKRAARLCHETEFMSWLVQTNRMKVSESGAITNLNVADWMRREIDIDTRAQLDHDPSALDRFETQIMAPYLRSQM